MNYEWHEKFTSHFTFHNQQNCIRESSLVSRRVLVTDPNEFHRPQDVKLLTHYCKMSQWIFIGNANCLAEPNHFIEKASDWLLFIWTQLLIGHGKWPHSADVMTHDSSSAMITWWHENNQLSILTSGSPIWPLITWESSLGYDCDMAIFLRIQNF